jgi:subtilisin family serine protease
MPALRRGGEEFAVRLADRSFTVRIPRADALHALREQHGVEDATPLTRTLVRVTAADVQARRDLVDRLRGRWRWPVEPTYEGDGDHRFDATGELMVGFDPAAKPRQVDEALRTLGAPVKHAYDHCVIDLGGDAETTVAGAERLLAHGAVRYAEPAIVNRFAAQAIDPVDEQYAQEWHIDSGELLLPDVVQDADARIRSAWATTKGSRGVVVAVLDDGFDLTHPDLQGPGKIVAAIDYTDGDANPLPAGSDYHGTCCAGVAVAEENGSGVVGVAPGCAFLPVRFPFNVPDPLLIEIFRYVSARAHVASCSWSPLPGYKPINTAFAETLTQLAAHGGPDGRGLIVCVAAGNFAAPVNGTPAEPVRWLEPGQDGTPAREHSVAGPMLNGLAAHPSVIAVGATTSLGRRAQYSNHGAELAVAAPSGDYDPVTLDRGRGRGITTCDNEASGPGMTAGRRFTHDFTGTSAATAVVAGICGLMKSAAPGITAAAVKDVLKRTTEEIDMTDDDTAFPGKANARRAVEDAHDGDYDTSPQPAPPAMPTRPPDWMMGFVAWGYGPVPGGVAPAGWVPGGAPAGWVPGGAAPAGWVPGGAAPAGWVPGGWVPGGWVPGGWVPGSPRPGDDGGREPGED